MQRRRTTEEDQFITASDDDERMQRDRIRLRLDDGRSFTRFPSNSLPKGFVDCVIWIRVQRICRTIINLLPISYQQQMATVKFATLTSLLDMLRRLETIYETAKQRKSPLVRYKEEEQDIHSRSQV